MRLLRFSNALESGCRVAQRKYRGINDSLGNNAENVFKGGTALGVIGSLALAEYGASRERVNAKDAVGIAAAGSILSCMTFLSIAKMFQHGLALPLLACVIAGTAIGRPRSAGSESMQDVSSGEKPKKLKL